MSYTQSDLDNLDRDRMQVHADMLQAFSNASKALNTITDGLVRLDFKKENNIQSFYDSLCYYTEGVQGLKRAFHAYADSCMITLVDPID